MMTREQLIDATVLYANEQRKRFGVLSIIGQFKRYGGLDAWSIQNVRQAYRVITLCGL